MAKNEVLQPEHPAWTRSDVINQGNKPMEQTKGFCRGYRSHLLGRQKRLVACLGLQDDPAGLHSGIEVDKRPGVAHFSLRFRLGLPALHAHEARQLTGALSYLVGPLPEYPSPFLTEPTDAHEPIGAEFRRKKKSPYKTKGEKTKKNLQLTGGSGDTECEWHENWA